MAHLKAVDEHAWQVNRLPSTTVAVWGWSSGRVCYSQTKQPLIWGKEWAVGASRVLVQQNCTLSHVFGRSRFISNSTTQFWYQVI